MSTIEAKEHFREKKSWVLHKISGLPGLERTAVALKPRILPLSYGSRKAELL